jgi:anaerobic magnesium-protoporphyrin IX monomethyl ester cyclase
MYDVVLTYPSDGLRLFDTMVPTGIASVAAVAEQDGFSVKIVDFNHYTGDFRRDLLAWRPKLLGIGGTTPSRRGSFLTARLAKQVFPKMPVVYGGVHASFTARETLTHVPHIDYVVKGEGEYPFLALCRRFVRGEPLDAQTAGLCYRGDNGSVVENRPSRIEDLSKLPPPARHLFDHRYKMSLEFIKTPADFIMTSRGCPACCTFCSASRMFPGGVRFRRMEQVSREIDALMRAGPIAGLKLFDSTFTASHEHVADFCAMIGPRNLLWECEIRADSVTKGLLRMMRESGCYYINMGLETTSRRLLASMGKRIRVEQAEQVLDWCRSLDIRTKVFFTMGHLGQTYQECVNDLAYMRERRASIDFFATTAGMRIYPGTLLEQKCRKQGIIPEDFSWTAFRPPLKNLLVLEPGDVPVLDQPQLPLWRLGLLIARLFLQRTLPAALFIAKFLDNNLSIALERIVRQCRYTRHRIARGLSAMRAMGRAS